jgi:hypothetical protein
VPASASAKMASRLLREVGGRGASGSAGWDRAAPAAVLGPRRITTSTLPSTSRSGWIALITFVSRETCT